MPAYDAVVKRVIERAHRKFMMTVRAELWRINPAGETLFAALEAWRQAATRDPADGYRLEKLKKLLREDRALEFVTAADLASVLPASSPATFNRYANIITAALNLAKHKGWIDTIPRITKKRVEVKRSRWLTPKEWRALYAELPNPASSLWPYLPY